MYAFKTDTVIIEGARFEFAVAGEGSPTVVLLNGAGGPLEAWGRIWPDVTASHRVFAYNRPGIARSSKPREPQTSEAVIRMLRALLGTIGLQPPYILVGHSLGGLHANFFARSYPREVAGVVFLDAATPDDVGFMAETKGRFTRAFEALLDGIFGKDALGETSHASESARLVSESGPFPDVPVIVITGGKPAMRLLTPARVLRRRAENQDALSRISNQGRQIIAIRSGHFPQFSEPGVVSAAIHEIADRVRGR